MVTPRQTPAAAHACITIFSLSGFSLIARQQVPLVLSSYFITWWKNWQTYCSYWVTLAPPHTHTHTHPCPCVGACEHVHLYLFPSEFPVLYSGCSHVPWQRLRICILSPCVLVCFVSLCRSFLWCGGEPLAARCISWPATCCTVWHSLWEGTGRSIRDTDNKSSPTCTPSRGHRHGRVDEGEGTGGAGRHVDPATP